MLAEVWSLVHLYLMEYVLLEVIFNDFLVFNTLMMESIAAAGC